MTPEQAQEKFTEWMQLQQELADVKAREKVLRMEIGPYYFPDAGPSGSHTLQLTEGWKLEYTTKITRSLENKKGETTSIIKQLPPEHANAAVGWNPSLQMAGYKDLPAQYRTILDSVLTSKPGAPTLKLIPPKGTV